MPGISTFEQEVRCNIKDLQTKIDSMLELCSDLNTANKGLTVVVEDLRREIAGINVFLGRVE